MVRSGSVSYVREQLDEWGWRALPKVGSEYLHKFPDPEAQSVWDLEWDLLIVLDSCRVDWMREVAPEYDFVQSVDEIWSVGGHSEEWLEETFSNGPRDEIEETAYVSGNPFVDNVADEPFGVFDDLNQLDYGVESPVAPAHVTTDRAIDVGRSSSVDRQIVHYMQPHRPFIEQGEERDDISVVDWSTGTDLYHTYFDGEKSKEELRDGYIDNLRYVLDDVSLLLENIEADSVVITADHGHALGERFLWDHRQGVQHPVMRRVPWVETTSVDWNTLEPEEYEVIDRSDEEVNDRLEALGYV